MTEPGHLNFIAEIITHFLTIIYIYQIYYRICIRMLLSCKWWEQIPECNDIFKKQLLLTPRLYQVYNVGKTVWKAVTSTNNIIWCWCNSANLSNCDWSLNIHKLGWHYTRRLCERGRDVTQKSLIKWKFRVLGKVRKILFY